MSLLFLKGSTYKTTSWAARSCLSVCQIQNNDPWQYVVMYKTWKHVHVLCLCVVSFIEGVRTRDIASCHHGQMSCLASPWVEYTPVVDTENIMHKFSFPKMLQRSASGNLFKTEFNFTLSLPAFRYVPSSITSHTVTHFDLKSGPVSSLLPGSPIYFYKWRDLFL